MIDAAIVAPWAAATFGIGAAIAAEQSFRFGNRGAAEDRWHGSDQFHDGLGLDQESDERLGRACAREIAAAYQAAATYLAAAAAVAAAAASQQGYVSSILALVGILCLAPIGERVVHARNEIEYLRAWYLRGGWDVDRKWVRSQDFAEEDAKFAKQYPKEAKALTKRRVQRSPPYDFEA